MSQKVVVPEACLQGGATVNFTTVLSANGVGVDIKVDDINLALNCPF